MANRALPQAELISELSKRTGLAQKDVKSVLSEFVEFATELLKEDQKIGLAQFGNFELRERPGRMGRNPQTGEAIEIKASKSVGFKIAKALKDQL